VRCRAFIQSFFHPVAEENFRQGHVAIPPLFYLRLVPNYSKCAQLLLAVDLFVNAYNYGFSSVCIHLGGDEVGLLEDGEACGRPCGGQTPLIGPAGVPEMIVKSTKMKLK
jgi:hypothetical protein